MFACPFFAYCFEKPIDTAAKEVYIIIGIDFYIKIFPFTRASIRNGEEYTNENESI